MRYVVELTGRGFVIEDGGEYKFEQVRFEDAYKFIAGGEVREFIRFNVSGSDQPGIRVLDAETGEEYNRGIFV